jgi:hypothetical protein
MLHYPKCLYRWHVLLQYSESVGSAWRRVKSCAKRPNLDFPVCEHAQLGFSMRQVAKSLTHRQTISHLPLGGEKAFLGGATTCVRTIRVVCTYTCRGKAHVSTFVGVKSLVIVLRVPSLGVT